MLTTKLGSLNGSGLAAFSTGPELNSEDAILFSLMASMLTPLKHRKKKKNIFEANPGGFFTPALNKTDMQGAQGSSRQPALEAGKHYLISKNTADTSRIPGARFPGSPRAKPRDCCPVPAVSLTLTAAKEVWLSSSYRKLRHRRTGLRLHSTHLFSLNPFYDTT